MLYFYSTYKEKFEYVDTLAIDGIINRQSIKQICDQSLQEFESLLAKNQEAQGRTKNVGRKKGSWTKDFNVCEESYLCEYLAPIWNKWLSQRVKGIVGEASELNLKRKESQGRCLAVSLFYYAFYSAGKAKEFDEPIQTPLAETFKFLGVSRSSLIPYIKMMSVYDEVIKQNSTGHLSESEINFNVSSTKLIKR